MSNRAIQIRSLGKMYKLYPHRLDKVLDVFGINRWLFWREKDYQEFWALRDLNLNVNKGERLGIIGRNGAGKSTLLKIISGIIMPTEGDVVANGHIEALMELGTGFHPEFTGRQNISASLSYQGFSNKSILAKEEEIIDFAELGDFIDQPLKTYSAGMYARLAFSVATSVEPEILVIDEVLGAGDAYFVGKCIERMRKITQGEGVTVLFVSHDLASVQRLSTRVIWLDRGKIIMDGQSHAVVPAYIEAMQRDTELRHHAREMRLTKNQAKAILTSEEIFTQLLFRLRTPDCPHPHQKHAIYSVQIQTGSNSPPLAHIDVGAPMDNINSGESDSYIIESIKNTDWTSPEKQKNEWLRYYANCDGRDGHAPFVLTIPSHLLRRVNFLELKILHSGTASEKVMVEKWDGKSYRQIGMLAQGNTTQTFESNFPVEIERKNEPCPPGDSTIHPIQMPQYPEQKFHDRELKSDLGSPLLIRNVDFILPNGQSTRVIPLRSPLQVDIFFEVFEKVRDPVFAVTFFALDGTQMDHQNSHLLNVRMGELIGKGKCSFTFNPFRLGVGNYLVTVAVLKYLDIDNWNDVPPSYDRHDRRYSISVYSEAKHGKSFGLVVQECSFKFDRDSKLPEHT